MNNELNNNKQYSLIKQELQNMWERCRQDVQKPSQALEPFMHEVTLRLIDIGVPGIDMDFVMECVQRKYDDCSCTTQEQTQQQLDDEWGTDDIVALTKGQEINVETQNAKKFQVKEKEPEQLNEYDNLFNTLFQ